MEVGLYGNTHGQSYRDDVNMFLHHTPVEQMDPIRVALTAEQIVGDLAALAAAGYSMAVCMLDCPSGTLSEQLDQIERFGAALLSLSSPPGRRGRG